jgi:hypothetical protein
MLIQLGDDFSRSQFIERDLFFFSGSREIYSHKSVVGRQSSAQSFSDD